MRANLVEPRTEEELASWKARDPIARAEGLLRKRGALDARRIAALHEEISAEIEAAVTFGKAGSRPTLERALASVYAPHANVPEPVGGGRHISFVEAINEGLRQEMERNSDVIVMGEDIGATGGIFQATRGLIERFGPDRVRETPITEATFVGCGVGAALAGYRPVVEIQIFDFVTLAIDMIVNQAAKFRFMMGAKPTVPLVIRGPHGGGIRMAAQHSQSLEAWFAHTPGLVVIGPSSPFDAKGLLISAIRDDNPVIFLESKLLYASASGPVPEPSYAIPIGKGIIKRAGTDITVVATMAMVPRALAAAEQLAQTGISVEVIDPRTLYPLDEELILESVRRTHRLVVVHEACTNFGFGAEIAARISEKAFDWLDAPVTRVGAPFMPMPYADELERQVIPTQQSIAAAIRRVLAID